MSSNYHLICMNHDPAILLGPQWSDQDEANAAAADRAGHGLGDHAHCELLIGRWSGGLIEIGCPPQLGKTTDPYAHYPFHPRTAQWIDVYWLHLLATAAAQSTMVMDDGLALAVKSAPGCWSANRARRLDSFLCVHTGREWSAKGE